MSSPGRWTLEDAIARWRAMVEAEHAQAEAMAAAWARDDYWSPFAGQFRPEVAEGGDPQLERVAALLEPGWTVLDVGAGGGRLAVPLARRCAHVTAVEPSPSMGGVLLEAAQRQGVRNITLVQAPWEAAEASPADLVLCSHVLYTVREVEPFVGKLESHARRLAAVFLFTDPPQYHLHPFWERVYGQARLRLPALQEFLAVLRQMGASPRLEMLPARPHRGYPDRETARELVRARLFIVPGSPEDRRLEDAMDDLLEPSPEGALAVKGAAPQQAGMVTWRPSRAPGQEDR